ncbi:MAG: RagB/SusD family nutrient uptake outer membrane protein [Bacteroidetes bacterium]|nr:RagB/SusD family nutrient uptake outer membrane protein [Bacteroidota bacterium]
MKKYFILYILLIGLGGCKKYLEQTSQNQIIPASTRDLVALMDAEGYPYNSKLCIQLNLLSDDVKCNGGQGLVVSPSTNFVNYYAALTKGKSPFTWQATLFEDMTANINTSTYVNCWNTIYQRISRCNIVIDYVSKVSGTTAAKNNILGQALAARGYYYFLLVNLFGQPYNAANPTTSLGVPLKLDMYATDSNYARSTVAQVYNQVEADYKAGAALMAQSPDPNPSAYHLNAYAAYGLLSRMYLYQEKWDSAIVYANQVLSYNPQLANFSAFQARGGYYMYNNGTFNNSPFNTSVSPEVLWAYQPDYINTTSLSASVVAGESEIFQTSGTPAFGDVYSPPFSVSDSLLNLYDARAQTDTAIYLGDLRSRVYLAVSPYLRANATVGYKFYFGTTGAKGIRTGEIYLNRAEANIRKFMATGTDSYRQAALADLNTLRTSRYDVRRAYTPITITDPNALLKFYQDERRRELPFEGQRWFDLRRYGMPAQSKWYEDVPGTGQFYTLSKGDARYTLRIPQDAMTRNNALVQNP